MNTRRGVVHRRVLRGVLLAAILAAGGLVIISCSNGLQTSAAGADPTGTVPSARASATTSATPSTAASAPAPAPSAPPTSRTSARPAPASESPRPTAQSAARCTVTTLQVGVRASEGGAAAGSNYVLLTYRNTGSGSCVLTGFPGVSFVGHGNGTQLGDPAVRNRSAASSPVRLAAGATTTSLLQIANAGSYDAEKCAPTTADGFRVYPPGSRAAVYVHFPVSACQRSTAGNPQLFVSPVGTSG